MDTSNPAPPLQHLRELNDQLREQLQGQILGGEERNALNEHIQKMRELQDQLNLIARQLTLMAPADSRPFQPRRFI